MPINWGDILTKVAGTAILAALAACVHLWNRVANLESEYQRDKLARDLECRHCMEMQAERSVSTHNLDKGQAAIVQLMTKMDTLLETCLRRLDILEKHIFKM